MELHLAAAEPVRAERADSTQPVQAGRRKTDAGAKAQSARRTWPFRLFR